MLKGLIKDMPLAPIFSTINEEDKATGIVVYSPIQGGRSLFSAKIVRELAVNMGKQNKELKQGKSVMVFDSESPFTALMEKLSPELCPVGFELVSATMNSFGSVDCFIDLLKHNLNVSNYDVSLVLIDLPGIERLFGKDNITESVLWKELTEVLLDNDISFILTHGVAPEFPLDRKDRALMAEHTYGVLENHEFRNRGCSQYFGISTAINFEESKYGELIVYSTSDSYYFECASLFKEMGFDT